MKSLATFLFGIMTGLFWSIFVLPLLNIPGLQYTDSCEKFVLTVRENVGRMFVGDSLKTDGYAGSFAITTDKNVVEHDGASAAADPKETPVVVAEGGNPDAKFRPGDCITDIPKRGEFTVKHSKDFFLVKKVGKVSYLTDFYWERDGGPRLLNELELDINVADRNSEKADPAKCQEAARK